MNLTDEQLAEVEELAGLFLEPAEIAVLLNINIRDFFCDLELQNTPVFRSYLRGKATSKKAIHENVVKLAKHGSPQAEDLVKHFIDKQQLAEKRARK